jgi:hypothetical protein
MYVTIMIKKIILFEDSEHENSLVRKIATFGGNRRFK